jgi:activating signal cointegrator 1
MKIITLWQPWASLLFTPFKGYETRSWTTNYRGGLAIHAAKRPMVGSELYAIAYGMYGVDRGYLGDAEELKPLQKWINEVLDGKELPMGAIIGTCDIKNCNRMSEQMIGKTSIVELSTGDWKAGRFAWKCENAIALPKPIPFKGSQGLRDLPDGVAAEVLAERREAIA